MKDCRTDSETDSFMFDPFNGELRRIYAVVKFWPMYA